MARRKKKARPAPPPPTRSERLYVRVAPARLSTLKFLLEGYGHLAVLSTVDSHAAVARLLYAPAARQEVLQFLSAAASLAPHTVLGVGSEMIGITKI